MEPSTLDSRRLLLAPAELAGLHVRSCDLPLENQSDLKFSSLHHSNYPHVQFIFGLRIRPFLYRPHILFDGTM